MIAHAENEVLRQKVLRIFPKAKLSYTQTVAVKDRFYYCRFKYLPQVSKHDYFVVDRIDCGKKYPKVWLKVGLIEVKMFPYDAEGHVITSIGGNKKGNPVLPGMAEIAMFSEEDYGDAIKMYGFLVENDGEAN